MPRIPRYRKHRASGRGVIQYRPLYGPNPHYLPGKFNSDESLAAYQREMVRILAHVHGAHPAPPPDKSDLRISQLFERYMLWAEPPRFSRGEFNSIRAVSRVVFSTEHAEVRVAQMHVADFGPLALKAVVAKMIELDWSRKYINNCLFKIRRVFRWGVSEELVDALIPTALESVVGLRKGKSGARESPSRQLVEWEHVEALLPFVPPTIQTMLQVQHLSGMRSDELCRMRPCEITKAKDVWIYAPAQHKTAHLEKDKVVCLGPRCRALLAPYEPAEPGGYYFTPALAMAERNGQRAARRKHQRHRKRKARKTNPYYTAADYAHAVKYGLVMLAIARSGDSSRPEQEDEPRPFQEWLAQRGVVGFTPHQLRHARATIVTEEHGLEAASAVIGDSIAATKLYSKRLLNLARRVALESG